MCPCYAITKRLFDLLESLVLLAVLSVPLLVVYLLVRLSSAGGGFFVQERAGKDGRRFRLIKFRTMRADHVHDPDPAIVIDGRCESLTGVGRLLRRFKLDELPQLLNVLAGRMSLVGPRPTVPEQAAAYDDFKRQRLLVAPGITGLAQVNGGTALTWDERIEWDVYYVHHCCWRMDLKILLATVGRLFTGAEAKVRRFREVHPDCQLPRGPQPTRKQG